MECTVCVYSWQNTHTARLFNSVRRCQRIWNSWKYLCLAGYDHGFIDIGKQSTEQTARCLSAQPLPSYNAWPSVCVVPPDNIRLTEIKSPRTAANATPSHNRAFIALTVFRTSDCLHSISWTLVTGLAKNRKCYRENERLKFGSFLLIKRGVQKLSIFWCFYDDWSAIFVQIKRAKGKLNNKLGLRTVPYTFARNLVNFVLQTAEITGLYPGFYFNRGKSMAIPRI